MLNIATYWRNASQNHNKISLHTSQKGQHQKVYWECKLVQSPWKTVQRFLKTLKIELAYDPAIPLLVMYLKKMKTRIQKDARTSMSTAALDTVAKTWSNLSSHQQIKKMWLMYENGILLSHKNRNFAICKTTWMDLQRREWLSTPVFLFGEFHGQRSLEAQSPWVCKESDMSELKLTLSLHFHGWTQSIILSEVSQRQILYVVTYMQSLKNKLVNTTNRNRPHRSRE